jgi:hypothetical protein
LYEKRLNLFVKEFANDFCKEDGGIDWDKLVQFNSGKNTPKKKYVDNNTRQRPTDTKHYKNKFGATPQ